MKLRIGAETANGKTRLEYIKTPSSPNNSPSYLIKKEKADEFVRKYNDLDTNMNIMGAFLTTASSIMGWTIAYEKKQAIKISLLGTLVGAITGVILNSIITHYKKNSLMNKYNVK